VLRRYALWPARVNPPAADGMVTAAGEVGSGHGVGPRSDRRTAGRLLAGRQLAVARVQAGLHQGAGRLHIVDVALARGTERPAPPLLAPCHVLVAIGRRADASTGRRTCRQHHAQCHCRKQPAFRLQDEPPFRLTNPPRYGLRVVCLTSNRHESHRCAGRFAVVAAASWPNGLRYSTFSRSCGNTFPTLASR